jgi:hypothetical protein
MRSNEIYLKRAELLIPTERECFSRKKNVLARTYGTFSSGTALFHPDDGPFPPDDGLFHPDDSPHRLTTPIRVMDHGCRGAIQE